MININHSPFLTADRSLLNHSFPFLLDVFRGSLFKHFNYDISNNSDVVKTYNVYLIFAGGGFRCSSAVCFFLTFSVLLEKG